MPVYELEFKIRHNCTLGELSFNHKSAKIIVWRMLDREIIEIVPKDGEDCSDAFYEATNLDHVVVSGFHDNGGYLISKGTPCTVSEILDQCMAELDILPIGPVMYNGGWQYHKVVVLCHEDINRLLEVLQERSFVPWILRKVPFKGFTTSSMTLTTDAIFSELTDKQSDALLTAYANGYYKMPREANLQTISVKIGIPRTTYQEHLKKAENKIISALIPHIHTWHHFEGSRGSHPLIREPFPDEKIIRGP
ncbi:MAG: helix-turn-helix domain-containing protein [Candidatus Thorarchaeota archaeon]